MRTKKSKRTKRSKKIKGGVVITGITSFPDYSRCRPEYDCTPSAFYDLGLISREDEAFFARVFPEGIKDFEILSILDAAYGIKHRYQLYRLRDFDDLKTRLIDGEGLLASSQSVIDGKVVAHSFVIYKKDNELYGRDAQTGTDILLTEYFEKFKIPFAEVTFTEKGERVARQTNKITANLIQTLAREGKLPSYVHANSPTSAWARS